LRQSSEKFIEENIQMAKRKLPVFTTLWSNYPTEQAPCDQGWGNQCAIRMSVCLEDSGFNLTNYTEPKCKHGHARGAESLGNYLWRQVGRPKIAKNAADGWANVAGKKGIVVFKDITGFREGRGDHTDLWNAGTTKTGEYFDSCKQSWFWEIT
jgi:hypothetical protein